MTELMTIEQGRELVTAELMHQAGQAANEAAAAGVFEDYTSRKAANTLDRQANDLRCFTDFLTSARIPAGELASDPEAWRGITWGLVEAFKRWMLQQGFAVSTVNFRLSTVKVYAKMAMKAGTLSPKTNENGDPLTPEEQQKESAFQYAMIHAVEGYAHKEITHVDELRKDAGTATRCGEKKADPVSMTPAQAKQLKAQPNTPQGRRDAVLMAILLDHGLRCGEVAILRVENFDLEAGTMTFTRPKVQKQQTHKLSKATLQALQAYLENDQPMLSGPLLLASRKGGHKGEAGGKLGGLGMTERAITKRVETLGELIGLPGLSAHDCRHYWATAAARNGTHIERLKDAGGWSSLAMPSRYIEAAAIANEGVNLGSD
jgi:integrase